MNSSSISTSPSPSTSPPIAATIVPPIPPSSSTDFETISGRFSMMSHKTTYAISADEVKRRMGAPECLNSSSLAGLLRRSKTKNCGEEMRAKMKQHNMEVDLCRRKGIPSTSITGLCEGELMHLASDLDTINNDTWPSKTIAHQMLNTATSQEKEQLVDEASDFMTVLPHIMQAFTACQPPLTGVPERKSGCEQLDREMNEFSLLTHGFGPINSRLWLSQMMKVGNDLMDLASSESKNIHI